MDSLLTGSSDSKWDILGYNSMYMNVDSPGTPLDVIQHCVYFKQHWEMVSFHERERERGLAPSHLHEQFQQHSEDSIHPSMKTFFSD